MLRSPSEPALRNASLAPEIKKKLLIWQIKGENKQTQIDAVTQEETLI